MQSLIPNLGVEDISKTVAYYQENFGFVLQMAVTEAHETHEALQESKNYLWAMVQNGGVTLMLQQVESLKADVGIAFTATGASASFYIAVDDADALYESVNNRVEIIKPIETSWYGQREFYVRDINGYVLGFASQAS